MYQSFFPTAGSESQLFDHQALPLPPRTFRPLPLPLAVLICTLWPRRPSPPSIFLSVGTHTHAPQPTHYDQLIILVIFWCPLQDPRLVSSALHWSCQLVPSQQPHFTPLDRSTLTVPSTLPLSLQPQHKWHLSLPPDYSTFPTGSSTRNPPGMNHAWAGYSATLPSLKTLARGRNQVRPIRNQN